MSFLLQRRAARLGSCRSACRASAAVHFHERNADFLPLAVFFDHEIFLVQTGDKTAVSIRDRELNVHQIDTDFQGVL